MAYAPSLFKSLDRSRKKRGCFGRDWPSRASKNLRVENRSLRVVAHRPNLGGGDVLARHPGVSLRVRRQVYRNLQADLPKTESAGALKERWPRRPSRRNSSFASFPASLALLSLS